MYEHAQRGVVDTLPTMINNINEHLKQMQNLVKNCVSGFEQRLQYHPTRQIGGPLGKSQDDFVDY